MKNTKLIDAAIVVVIVILPFGPAPAFGQEADVASEVEAEAQVDDGKVVFQKMPVDQVRTELLQWLASTGADRAALQQVTKTWADDESITSLSGEELLDLLVLSFAEVDVATQRLIQDSYGSSPPEGVVFDGIREATIFRNQIQQFRARWMVQHRYYDDALPLLAELVPEAVVDPAGLLFYRAVCQSQLMRRTEAVDSLSLLLNNTLDVPERFLVIAEMLQQELADQKEGGLGKVSQLMQDVERRLELEQSGKETQDQEIAIIVALDKLLEDMEKEQKKKNSSSGGGDGTPNGSQQTQGADRSMIKGGNSATGEADRKKLTENGKWGMMNQQTEAKARELIRQKLPANFLDQIRQYTKKIAEQNR